MIFTQTGQGPARRRSNPRSASATRKPVITSVDNQQRAGTHLRTRRGISQKFRQRWTQFILPATGSDDDTGDDILFKRRAY